jgi:4-aminobutyrate aminotransferase-like enzyme
LNIAKSKGWFENALVTGQYLLKELEFLNQSEFIAGLRGDGMALAFDIIKPASYTAIAEPDLPNMFVNICLERRLLVFLSGTKSNTIKITPPINLTIPECQIIINRLRECFIEFSNKVGLRAF